MNCWEQLLAFIDSGFRRLLGQPPGCLVYKLIDAVSTAIVFYILLGLLGELGQKLQHTYVQALCWIGKLLGKCIATVWHGLVWTVRSLVGKGEKNSQ